MPFLFPPKDLEGGVGGNVYRVQPPEYAGPEDSSRLQLSSPTVFGNN